LKLNTKTKTLNSCERFQLCFRHAVLHMDSAYCWNVSVDVVVSCRWLTVFPTTTSWGQVSVFISRIMGRLQNKAISSTTRNGIRFTVLFQFYFNCAGTTNETECYWNKKMRNCNHTGRTGRETKEVTDAGLWGGLSERFAVPSSWHQEGGWRHDGETEIVVRASVIHKTLLLCRAHQWRLKTAYTGCIEKKLRSEYSAIIVCPFSKLRFHGVYTQQWKK